MNTNCINCGYDISATAPNADCPECGLPVARSISLTLGEEPAKRLLRATQLVFWGTIGMYALMLFGGVIVFVFTFGSAMSSPSAQPQFTGAHWTTAIAGIAAGAFLAWAWWMLTHPLPGTSPEADVRVSRRMLRLLLLVTLGLSIVAMVKPLVMPYVPAPMTPAPQPTGTGAGASGITWSAIFTPSVITDWVIGGVQILINAALLLFQARYLRFVSNRIPGRPGLTLAEVNVWLLPLLATVGILACGTGPLVASVMLLVHMGMLIAGLKRYLAWSGPGESHA